MLHKLVEIPRSEWTKLRDLYEDRRNESTGYSYLQNFIDWVSKDPEADVRIYSLDGDWESDGTFIVNDFGSFGCNTLSDDLSRLVAALNCLDKDAIYFIHSIPDRVKPAVDAHLKYCGIDKTCEVFDGTFWFHLSKEEALKLVIVPPAGITLGPLDIEHAEQVNRIWPHRFEGSVEFVKRLIRYNESVGAFTENGSLVAWVLRLNSGALGVLQVEESHKRQGLGSLVVRSMAKKIAAKGMEIYAPVVLANTASREMFTKLGFKVVDKVWWVWKPGTSNRK